MASLDLSAKFDLINVKLHVKQLKIVGLPTDIIDLIKARLSIRHCYVVVNDDCSNFYISIIGTVQGSIPGTLLYVIYVFQIFYLKALSNLLMTTLSSDGTLTSKRVIWGSSLLGSETVD
jgi:hypothetical protein